MFFGLRMGLPKLSQGGSVLALSPDQVPGLLAWYESDFGFSIDGSNNLQSWLDKSGNGFTFSQTSAALRPATTLASINGFPAASFLNGGNKLMTATSDFAGGSHSLIIVAKPTGIGTNFAGGLCLGSDPIAFHTSDIGTYFDGRFTYGGYGFGAAEPSAPTVGTTYVLGKMSAGVAMRTFKNGLFNFVETEATPVTPTPTTAMLFGVYFPTGANAPWDIAAMCAFRRPLLDSEMASVQKYFMVKYVP